MEFIILDGTKMTTPEETHRYLARVLRLPAYYGANLDALADCLSELGGHVCITLMNEWAMRAQLGEYADKLLSVFMELSTESGAFKWISDID